jgi:nifR3 family TIM-barrel protein
MREATIISTLANPDLIDINYGCPVKNVACKGAGAGILKDIPKMVRMTSEVVKATHLPVTVKTRLGWDESSINIVEVAERLQDVGIEALTIHGRTRVQMYKGTANWTKIGEVKNNPRMQIPVFLNGDVDTPVKVKAVKERYGVDGVMIGRASIGYPWIFNEIKHFLATGEDLTPPSIEDRIHVCKTHFMKSLEWKGEKLGVLEMRRHYSNYFKGFPHFKEHRMKLVTATDPKEILSLLDEITFLFQPNELA